MTATLLVINLLLIICDTSHLIFTTSVLYQAFNVPPLVVNVAIIDVNASLPRVVISLTTSLRRRHSLTINATLNSGVVGVLLVLNLTTLIHPFAIRSSILHHRLPLVLLIDIITNSMLCSKRLDHDSNVFLLFLTIL